MKFNIKNLVLSISIIASISGNCSNATKQFNSINTLNNSANNNTRLENVNNNNRLITDYFKINNNKNNRNKLITDYFKNKKLVSNVKESSYRRRYNRRHNIIKVPGVYNHNIRKGFTIGMKGSNNILYNLAINNISKKEKDYIKNIMISVNEIKDNWYDTTLPLSQEQNDTIKNIERIRDNFLGAFKIKSSKNNNMIYKKFKSEDQKLFVDIFLHNVLDNGIYYALLQQVNHYIFIDAYYINSGMIDNLIKNIKENTTDIPDEYKSFV